MKQLPLTIGLLSLGICLALLNACSRSGADNDVQMPLFSLLDSNQSGLNFVNHLPNRDEFNIYTYRNFYNGAGVAIGDVNQDGLQDIFLTANLESNRLFLNKGDLKFEDITQTAGIAGEKAWSTGVSMADVNADGWIDIYVCNSGDIAGDNKQNELFINQKDGTFLEQAADYGLADPGYSTHAAFFDYDRDGDLDVYLLNNSYKAIGSFNTQYNMRDIRDEVGGDKLLRNDGGIFVDVSEAAGIYGSVIGFGLGVTVGDLNADGWQDIYVSNDFFERDYIYINQQDGTFSEELTDRMHSISGASMGADMADINNDAAPEIFVTEMLPQPDARIKTVTTFENWDRYQINLRNGYYHQFTRNMLQLNNQDNTFSEVGRMAGVEATDWSWGALITDLDNDGWKDLYIANGIYKDLTDQDFLVYISDAETQKKIVGKSGVNYDALIDAIPSNPVSNYAYRNLGQLSFEDQTEEWGLNQESFSNGSAYADLDNDGDLDLVVNNVNMPLFLYRNDSRQQFPERHYLKLDLQGEGNNTQALGAQVRLYLPDQSMYLEHMPIRGFQSSMDPRPHFGLGEQTQVDSLVVNWPNGNKTLIANPTVDQTLVLQASESIPSGNAELGPEQLGKRFQEKTLSSLDFSHQEDEFIDFNRDRLIFHMLSNEGPKICKGDFNGDGREDIYIGGAKDQAGALYLQQSKGRFKSVNEALFAETAGAEDSDCACFDADGDGDLDLYVASGSNESSTSSENLRDRLYLNDGKAEFKRSAQRLPTSRKESTGCVRPHDFDGDGDIDLFVGIRLRPFLYGVPMNGYLLENDGTGQFSVRNADLAPDLQDLGMITDAQWFDWDQDQDADLMVVGEYMPICVFRQENGRFQRVEVAGLDSTEGFWNVLQGADLDGDGDTDFVAGNHGLNSRFRASKEKPVCMYINDFDQNGMVEQIVCTFNGAESYPLVLRHDLVSQMPELKKKYLEYSSYKEQRIQDMFTPAQLEKAIKLNAYQMASSIIWNDGGGNFRLEALPLEAQLSPVFALGVSDVDQDGQLDILLGGNQYRAKPEVGIYDASFGMWLKGTGNNHFEAIPATESGWQIKGEMRDVVPLMVDGQTLYIVAMNNDKIRVFSYE